MRDSIIALDNVPLYRQRPLSLPSGKTAETKDPKIPDPSLATYDPLTGDFDPSSPANPLPCQLGR